MVRGCSTWAIAGLQMPAPIDAWVLAIVGGFGRRLLTHIGDERHVATHHGL